MKITRFYLDKIGGFLKAGKVFVLYGPRRSGKTTLLNDFMASWQGGRYFVGSGEDRRVQEILESADVNLIKSSFSGYELVVIDEAQAVKSIGRGLKMLVDCLPEVKVIASGSSSFQLAENIGEPLTGRRKAVTLYPIAALELARECGNMALQQRLEELMIYGSYPEILTLENFQDKAEALRDLCDSYLFKDILVFENVRNSSKLRSLLTLLAFQIGKEVSITEIGASIGLNRSTVERYIDLLEKTFVLFTIPGFSRNLRSEVTRTKRYYFYDNGILNAIINNFNHLNLRGDTGGLWENLLVIERIKKQSYHRLLSNNYFWRTYEKQEIDFVEEREGNLFGYEFKWGAKIPAPPPLWRQNYPQAQFMTVNRTNFLDFVL